MGVQVAIRQHSDGNAANRAGHPECADLPVRAPPSPTVSGHVRRHHCGLSVAAAWGCRGLDVNSLTGALPTELGTMDALLNLCVRNPHPPPGGVRRHRVVG